MTDIGPTVVASREQFAANYIVGNGIEIGALDAPFPINKEDARVSYVDRFPKAELLRHYPELTDRASFIREPDIVDDGEKLLSLADNSQDFVIASHFLEHCENPLATLANHCRILKPGGRLLLAVPNTANPLSWDHQRARTDFDHLVRDDVEGPEVSRAEHYYEWVTFAGKMTGDTAVAEIKHLMQMNYSIHFHCWEQQSFHDFVDRAIIYKKLDLRVVANYDNAYEIGVMLEKTAPQIKRPTGNALVRWWRAFRGTPVN